MSRLDEALKRAGQRFPAPDGAAGESRAHPVPDPLTFTSPWDFEAAASRLDTGPSGVTEPRHAGQASAPHVPDMETARTTALARRLPKWWSERLVLSASRHPGLAERYRRLAATLHHAQGLQSLKTVMVASAGPGEGKTLTATNLALTFAESFKRRVLLVDADLRRPSLHEVFQVPNLVGLTEGLRSQQEQKLPIHQVTEHLSFLPAGRPDPDPMAALTSARMRQVLSEASAAFDWVILDTPPVGVLTDASLLAAMVDSVLLVVRAGSTPYHVVDRASQALGRERVLGIVLNATEGTTHGGYYHYDDYYSRGPYSSPPEGLTVVEPTTKD